MTTATEALAAPEPQPEARKPLLFRPWWLNLGRFPELIVEGPRGTSKTTGILSWIYEQMRTVPMLRVLMCRSTRTRLTDGAMVTFEKEVLGPGHPLVGSIAREHRHSYVMPHGAEMVCGGFEDINRLLSTPWDIIYVNEIAEITEEQWEALGGGLRSLNIPGRKKRWGQSVRIGDINPVHPGFWANRRCGEFPERLRPKVLRVEDYPRCLTPEMYVETMKLNAAATSAKSKRCVTYHADNPGYFDMDNWAWWPEGLYYVKTMLDPLSPYQRGRWLEGRWRAAEGAVYPEFNEQHHVVEPFEIPGDWPCEIWEDPGYDHPTAILLFAIAPNGRKIVVDEYVRRGTTVEADAKFLTEHWGRYRIRRKWGAPQDMFSKNKFNSGEPIATQMEKFGHRFIPGPAAHNQREIAAMVDLVRRELTTLAADGLPMLLVFGNCPCTINGFQSWGFKRNSKGEQTGGDDAYEDLGDDEMDCVRGFIATGPVFESTQSALHRRSE